MVIGLAWKEEIDKNLGVISKPCTVKPRLTNTLAGQTPLLNEQFWSVPNNFYVKPWDKEPRRTNGPHLATVIPSPVGVHWKGVLL